MERLGRSLGAGFRMLVLVLTSMCLGCRPGSGGGSPPAGRDITAVMEAHTAELMAIPGVTGVAIGALDDGRPCILVLVLKKTAETRKLVPASVEGYPVKVVESGTIRPMSGDSSR
jgi:hypothetical protein